MAFYVIERTIKKRRGCYSESDIHISPCYLESRNYYARYNFSDVKNINIPETTKNVINSFEAYYLAGGEYNEKIIIKDCTIRQDTTIELIPDPIISISNDLGYISYARSINYKITDSDPTTRFKIVYKLNDIVIGEKYNTTDSNYTIDLTEEHLSKLSFKSKNNITIELSTSDGGVFLTKIVSFTKGNTKPKLNISSYNSTSATFKVIDIDNNLSKIEWFIDDMLKETITTDLTSEKTINYELTDNAIHTLKIVVTDAENATAEKILSVSKSVMPLEDDSSLEDIANKIDEMKEVLSNGKTSIVNVLALKNVEANLNNTLVELSEKIKTSFDSSDASVQELQNQLTEKNNTISQLNNAITDLNRQLGNKYNVYTRTIRYSTTSSYATPISEGGYSGSGSNYYILLPFEPKFLFIISSSATDLGKYEHNFSYDFDYNYLIHGSFTNNNDYTTIGKLTYDHSSINNWAKCCLFISTNSVSKGKTILRIATSDSSSNSFGCVLNICAIGK